MDLKTATMAAAAATAAATQSHDPSAAAATQPHDPSAAAATQSHDPSAVAATQSHDPSAVAATQSHDPSATAATQSHDPAAQPSFHLSLTLAQSKTGFPCLTFTFLGVWECRGSSRAPPQSAKGIDVNEGLSRRRGRQSRLGWQSSIRS